MTRSPAQAWAPATNRASHKVRRNIAVQRSKTPASNKPCVSSLHKRSSPAALLSVLLGRVNSRAMKATHLATVERPVLDQAIRRAKRRLLPFMLLMYVLAYLDRANVGYAKQAYQAATGITDAVFALGAGIFFLTYALFEVPSNLTLHRLGARVWMGRIMVSWGFISAAMVFAGSEAPFLVVRLLLGAAEAGFFQGAYCSLHTGFRRMREAR